MSKEETTQSKEVKIEDRLIALYSLQKVDSQIDRIKTVHGELPLEVEDLEDEIAGLETRLARHREDIERIEGLIKDRREAIKQCEQLIKRYEEQQMNVRNNREYDSITKEIEFQGLEIQLQEKKIREHSAELEIKKAAVEESEKKLLERQEDLTVKKKELTEIVAETAREEEILMKHSQEYSELIEERLLTAYKRIRKNAMNGLAVVKIERDACGGCFNKIPPQRHLDIRMHKKVIVCEYCGRILVDSEIDEIVQSRLQHIDLN
ncbi:MAG TPA: C4-type zinc ribbon domain-containing protein [Bacteroidales bacterium]|nr:C4-type zinc ribbon domain-containing protein [Bacteroidales bacterium]HRZ49646.1 C4-type zinc ribbon domain-containing protein [Bacteroidales bacterium]